MKILLSFLFMHIACFLFSQVELSPIKRKTHLAELPKSTVKASDFVVDNKMSNLAVGPILKKNVEFEQALISAEFILSVSATLTRDNLELFKTRIHEFKNLKDLTVNVSEVNVMPSEICNLPNLERLELIGLNNEFVIPPSIENLNQLVSLRLVHLTFLNLPSNIKEMDSLNHLTFLNCEFKDFEPEISGLSSLKSLTMNNCGLKTLSIGVESMSSLVSLDVRYNRLTTVPIELANLQDLKWLSLYGNPIEDLPLELVDCPSLLQILITEPENSTLKKRARKIRRKSKTAHVYYSEFKVDRTHKPNGYNSSPFTYNAQTEFQKGIDRMSDPRNHPAFD